MNKCDAKKVSLRPGRFLMQQYLVASVMVAVDVLGSLPKEEAGDQHILVAMNCFARD